MIFYQYRPDGMLREHEDVLYAIGQDAKLLLNQDTAPAESLDFDFVKEFNALALVPIPDNHFSKVRNF